MRIFDIGYFKNCLLKLKLGENACNINNYMLKYLLVILALHI